MDIEILSLFPEYFKGPFDSSILKKAQEKGILNINHVNVRDFAEDKHHRVDERPFGGGPGMVMKPEPLVLAIRSAKKKQPQSRVIYLSPQGSLLTGVKCQELALCPHLTLVCGHYEGIDERVLESEIDEEISIGDYVLTNGALAAIVLVDAVARFVPGVLGHHQAALQDSFQEGIFDCPHYTRPEEFEGRKVPEVLLRGDHAEIATWRRKKALEKTRRIRPDLYYSYLAKEAGKENGDVCVKGDVSLILPAGKLRTSVPFYRKVLKLPLVFQDDERAIFDLGHQLLILVEDESTHEPLFKVGIKQRDEFEKLVLRLKSHNKEIGKLQTRTEEVVTLDSDGYRWMFYHCKGE